MKKDAALQSVTEYSEPTHITPELERILARVPPMFPLPPRDQRCPYTGETRAELVELITPTARNEFKPPVRGIYRKRHKHAQRGRWLILAENIFAYLLSLQPGSLSAYMEMSKERERIATVTK